jgi:hypothetical protein
MNEIGDTLTSVGKVRAKQSTEVLGPCLVSIGSPLVTHIKFEASQNMISNYKSKYVLYRMYIFNGKKAIGHIGICQHPQPYMFRPEIELRDYLEPLWKGKLGSADSFTREIYGGAGAVTIGTGWGLNGQRASFMHKINDVTTLNGYLQWLSEEEAMKLIYSIHVELREKPAPKQEASSTGIDLVQKLKQLKDARDAGLISEDEYQEKRKTILSKM